MYEALQTLPERGKAVMVGYLLKNTVSKYGTVTRGVCHTADGQLTDIRETMKIQLFPDGSIADMADGTRRDLDGDSVVSMNFWGFSPAIYEDMEQYFHDFLRHVGDDIKAECLLPAMVGDLMDKGQLTVSVLHSAEKPQKFIGPAPCGGGSAEAPRRGRVSRQAGVTKHKKITCRKAGDLFMLEKIREKSEELRYAAVGGMN